MMDINKIKQALGDGLLSFPVTDMDAAGQFNPDSYADRLKWFLSYDISAVFVAGGTGEFFSLSAEEYWQIINIATRMRAPDIPVISSVGRSIPEAIRFAGMAEEAGIDGLLLMPPYLAHGPEDGVYEYAKAIISSTSLPVIYYNRANGILSAQTLAKLAEECPNLIGLKDGTGNIQDLNDTIKTIGDRLVYIGGVPTAEIISEAYLAIGVNTYSSAVFNFVPEMALEYYRLLRSGEQERVKTILQEFYIPFVRLRSRKKGYAVSLIKAGAQIIGRDAGQTRPPLVMPTPEEHQILAEITDRAKGLTTS